MMFQGNISECRFLLSGSDDQVDSDARASPSTLSSQMTSES